MRFVCLLVAFATFCYVNSLPLRQPTIIEIDDKAALELSIDYCSFKTYHPDDSSVVAVSENTYCYCYESDQPGINIIPDSGAAAGGSKICDVPGPTLVVYNGTSFNITFHNNLVGESFSNKYGNSVRRAWPDVTNVHTHGLHVSPVWDDILWAINPQSSRNYYYEVNGDHYPGIHWYHAHLHRSVNFQIQTGLFGALLVKAKGINDEKDPDYEMTDIVMVMNHLYSYTTDTCECTGSEDDLTDRYSYVGADRWPIYSLCFDWCDMPEEQRMQSGFEYNAESIFADSDGKIDFPLVNGQITPTVNIDVDKWYRLRFLNANNQLWVEMTLPKHTCSIYLMAMDGILFRDGWRNLAKEPYFGQFIIDPGARADVAIRCYVVTSLQSDTVFFSTFNGTFHMFPRFPNGETAFYINVNGEVAKKKKKPFQIRMVDDMIRAKVNINKRIRAPYKIPQFPRYLTDTRISCHGSDTDVDCVTDQCPCWTFPDPTDLSCHWKLQKSAMNAVPFNASKPILYVCDDLVYEFRIESTHPFHSHSAPYQVMQDLPYDGNHFSAMAGDFRDVVTAVEAGYKIRFQTFDWLGPMVVHCHFIPHEDQGMMAYFQVVDCDDVGLASLNPVGYDPVQNMDLSPECKIFD